MINHYSILGVPNYSSWAVVRKAYIIQIKKYHPDVNSTQEAIDICQRLNVAKEALETNDKKSSYDARLKYYLTYGRQRRTNTQTRKRRYTPPPMSRAERVKRNKERRDKIKLAEYAKGLESFTLRMRYVMCSIYGLFGLFILTITVVDIEDFVVSLLIGFVASCFWFHANTLYINEYYKYQDYLGRTKPLDFDLDKRSSSRLYTIYLAGFVFAVLVKMAASW